MFMYYLILDVGTTNVKAIAFSSNKPILELQERSLTYSSF